MIRPKVVITHETVAAMLQDPKFLAEIPCLKIPAGQLKKLKPGCTTCVKEENARKQKDIIAATYGCLKELSEDGRNKLKKLLNTKAYSFVTINSRKRPVTMHY